MPSFVWKGRTRTGQIQEGVLLADTRGRRRRRAAAPADPGHQHPREGAGDQAAAAPAAAGSARKRIAIFTRQFSVMLDAGLPLVQCLEILGEPGGEPHLPDDHQPGAQRRRVRLLARRLHAQAPQGVRQPLRQHGGGRRGGRYPRHHPAAPLDLHREDRQAEQPGQVGPDLPGRRSSSSPRCVVFIILWKVIPVFAQLFAGLGGEMPLLTRIVIGASNFVGRYFIFIIAGRRLRLHRAHRWHKTPPRPAGHRRRLLKIPIIGMLLRKIAVARFCRTLATLTASGVPILDGLEITAKTAGNAIIEDAVMAVRKSVEEGKTISDPLAQTKVFPAMVVQMINVGEQTGALDQMLAKIADFYEEEVDTAVAGLMKLIEPIMITFLGAIIGTIVTPCTCRSTRSCPRSGKRKPRRPGRPAACLTAPRRSPCRAWPTSSAGTSPSAWWRSAACCSPTRSSSSALPAAPQLEEPRPASVAAAAGASPSVCRRRAEPEMLPRAWSAARRPDLRRHPALHRPAAPPAPAPDGPGLHPVLRRPAADHRPWSTTWAASTSPFSLLYLIVDRRGLDAAAPARRRHRGERGATSSTPA